VNLNKGIMYQKQYADRRLESLIKSHIGASDSYIEAVAWASFSGTHSITEIANEVARLKKCHS